MTYPLTLLLNSGVAITPGPRLARPVLVGVAGVHHPGAAHLGSTTPQTGEAKVVLAVALSHAVELASGTAVSHAWHGAGLEA